MEEKHFVCRLLNHFSYQTIFIDFLKDHSLTLKKVSTHLQDVNAEQLEEILSCLPCGTHVTLLHFSFCLLLGNFSWKQELMSIKSPYSGLPWLLSMLLSSKQ